MSTQGAKTPFQRLTRTAKVFETVFFGTRAEADRALAAVHALHERVRGTLPVAAGRWAAGTPYSAWDPDLMLWTLGCIADSGQAMYQTFVRKLSADEREALWQDYLLFGELFGLSRADAPPTYMDFRAYWAERLASDDLALTPTARVAGRQSCFEIPLPRHLLAAREMANLLLLGTIPARVRELYGFSFTLAQQAAFQAAAASLRRASRITPDALRRGPNTASFNLVARTERDLQRRGKQRATIFA